MGKGDDVRKRQVPKDVFDANWDKIFNKNKSKKSKNNKDER
tara:strand:- start:55 stop:177 length:123 start_codon:yes stop_codon:yes gene_type:complete